MITSALLNMEHEKTIRGPAGRELYGRAFGPLKEASATNNHGRDSDG